MTRQIKQLTQGQIVGRVHSIRADPRARTYFLHFRPPPTHVPQQSQRQRLLSNNFLQATLAWTHMCQESLGSYMVLGTSGVYFPLSVGVLRRGYLHGHLDMLNNLAQQRYFPLLFSAPTLKFSRHLFIFFILGLACVFLGSIGYGSSEDGREKHLQRQPRLPAEMSIPQAVCITQNRDILSLLVNDNSERLLNKCCQATEACLLGVYAKSEIQILGENQFNFMKSAGN